MKSLILTVLFASTAAQAAQTYTYNCKSQKHGWAAQVSLNEQELTIPGDKSLQVYTNTGLFGGNGNLSETYAYVLDPKKSTGGNVSDGGKTYFVTPALLAGGRRLKDGTVGGYIFAQWEDNDYLKCSLK